MVVDVSGSSWVRFVAAHAGIPGSDVGNKALERHRVGGNFTEGGNHLVRARGSEDQEPDATRRNSLRMLRAHAAAGATVAAAVSLIHFFRSHFSQKTPCSF